MYGAAREVHMGFVVDDVTMGQECLEMLRFPLDQSPPCSAEVKNKWNYTSKTTARRLL
jgi:hypothetical protein